MATNADCGRRPLELQRPLFGQFAQQHVGISTADLREGLQFQEEHGGRLGEILVQRGLLERSHVHEILGHMARWVAGARHRDMPEFGFPRPYCLSVCMPCFNEADVIEDCLAAACAVLPHFVEDFELIIVDDGSRDNTGDLVEAYGRRDNRVRLIRHETNRGYGAAVTTGMKAAEGDLVMFTDGDGQFSMLDVPQLLAHVEDADYVVGYRHQRAEGGLRRLNAWSWGRLIRWMLGVRVRDLDCAFKAFPRDIVQQLEMTATGACINAEVMAQLAGGSLTFQEVPVMHYPRYHGAATGANLRVIMRAFKELPQLWKYRGAAPIERRDGHERIADSKNDVDQQRTVVRQ